MFSGQWLTEAQLGLRFGLPPRDVKALVSQGRTARVLPRRGGKTSKFPTKYDVDAFGRLPGLLERQKTKEARLFQWEHNLWWGTAWDVLLKDDFL